MPDTGLNATGKSLSGVTGAKSVMQYAIQDNYGTAIGYGDPVVLSSGYIIQCPETAKPTGILRGAMWIDSVTRELRFSRFYPANTTNAGSIDGVTDVVALVEPIEDNVFFIQTSDAAFAQADVGTTKRLKSVGANAAGFSTAVVDMDASVTTEVRLVRLLGLLQRPGNVFGTGAVAEVTFV